MNEPPHVIPLDYAPRPQRPIDYRYRIRIAAIVVIGIALLLPIIGRLPDPFLIESQQKLDATAAIAMVVALTGLALSCVRRSR